eukprot:Plantae.Rhodophyta-Purpureofilum_apyrenoidigerum.ctg6589.p1 GENE.Plantae.Rhodophyta-Purpureofilum_apyrenoidigerum.ctg6589~~Plantae.Rhodophyta-Purpureofilum_apyrenoidigerum.ctg6589.p1  ORF type:complete len:134 (-),score=27.14 Plantae.Rhodophyta-Purpureofilum_apyrenoidigerum.ctg6589:563-964(-)
MTDTPGLLNRDQDTRNLVEMLSVAAIQHLHSIVLFVVDLTEECGTTVEDQLQLRDQVWRMCDDPAKRWIDVRSKSDLQDKFCKTSVYDSIAPASHLVSMEDKDSLRQLQEQFVGLLLQVMASKSVTQGVFPAS